MTPTLPQVLRGAFLALAAPADGDAGPGWAAARAGAAALLVFLAQQEAVAAEAAERAENAAMRALLEEGGCAPPPEPDRSAENDALRRALIGFHAAAEARGDRAADARVLALYRAMAGRRLLHLPPPG